MLSRFILFLILITSNSYSVEKHLYIFGGGGDPKGTKTIFDNDLKALGKFAKNSDWKTTVNFDGGHSDTEKIIAERFKSSTNMGDFVESNFDKVLADIEMKIKSKSLKAGDQMLIALDTHGAIKNSGQDSHSVAFARNAATELTNLNGADRLSLDRLKSVINLAKNNNIKLAFIDQSCHSGASLNLADVKDNICIITATGDKHYGYAGSVDLMLFSIPLTFGGKFFREMKPGKNLEEIFLSARSGDSNADFPMISTENGREIQNLLYELMTPFLYYNDQVSSKFNDQYDIKKIDQANCMFDKKYNELIEKLTEFQKMKEFANQVDVFTQLKKALASYRSYQRDYEFKVAQSRNLTDKIDAILKKDYPVFQGSVKDEDTLSWITVDYKAPVKYFQDLYDVEKNKEAKDLWKYNLDIYKTRQKNAAEIMSKLDVNENKSLQGYRDLMNESNKVTTGYAEAVAWEAKKVYKTLYVNNMSKNESNPCRDFVL